MWNNQKQQTLFSLMSNLQTYYHFKLDFQKVDHNIHISHSTIHIWSSFSNQLVCEIPLE